MFLEHGTVEIVRDVIEGVEDAGLVRDGRLADVNVVEVLFLFVRLDTRVVYVVGSHGGNKRACVCAIFSLDFDFGRLSNLGRPGE